MISRSTNSWFGQPKGLTILFLTEMWEIFSFYGMRALQIYYMTKQLHFSQEKSSLIYGIYTAGVYLTPIAGAIISDRWLGRHKAVVIGGILMVLGHFTMTFEQFFFPAMILIAIGNGLFLPNLPSQINHLYTVDDPRRTGAFNVYYVGANLGGFLAPLICGTLGELYGWHYGFGAAGIGMCLGLIIYVRGIKYLPPEPLKTASTAVAIATPDAAKTVQMLLAIIVAVVLFRSAYEQTGNTLALWADTSLDRTLFNRIIPVTWFQSLNPLFIFLLTPFFVRMWSRAARNHKDLSPLHKMAIGAFGLAVFYCLLATVSYFSTLSGTKVNWPWLVAFLVIFTVAELYILPVGLGLFARLAPQRFEASAIAAWFFAAFAGNLLAGIIGTWWSSVTPTVFFVGMAGIATVSSLLLLACDPLVRSLESLQIPLKESS